MEPLEVSPSNEVAFGALIGGWVMGGIVVGIITYRALMLLIAYPNGGRIVASR